MTISLTYWTFRTDDDAQTCVLCPEHSAGIIVQDGTTAIPAEDDCDCDFCPAVSVRA